MERSTTNSLTIIDRLGELQRKSLCLIAIDGPGNSGKSTLAREVASALEAVAIVGMDDFYQPMSSVARASLTAMVGYQQYFDWQRLQSEVLEPLSAGAATQYQRYDWATNALAEWVNIEPHGTVIVEGVYTTRPELRSYYDLTVFIQTSRAERLRRAIEHRANDLFWIKRWMAAEDWYLRTLKPARHVDIVFMT